MRRELVADPRGELAPAAADLEDASGAHLGDCLEGSFSRVRSRHALVHGRPRDEPVLGRVLGPNDLGVVEAHRSMIGEPGAPFPGCFAPSQADDRRADVAELAVLVDAPGRVAPGRVGEQQRVLARVVARRRRRVAAVVRRDDQQVALAQRLEDVRQAAVEVLQAAMEVDGVVAVAPELVGLDEVREDEARRRCSRAARSCG